MHFPRRHHIIPRDLIPLNAHSLEITITFVIKPAECLQIMPRTSLIVYIIRSIAVSLLFWLKSKANFVCSLTRKFPRVSPDDRKLLIGKPIAMCLSCVHWELVSLAHTRKQNPRALGRSVILL